MILILLLWGLYSKYGQLKNIYFCLQELHYFYMFLCQLGSTKFGISYYPKIGIWPIKIYIFLSARITLFLYVFMSVTISPTYVIMSSITMNAIIYMVLYFPDIVFVMSTPEIFISSVSIILVVIIVPVLPFWLRFLFYSFYFLQLFKCN